MAGVSGVPNYGASALHALQQLSTRTSSIADRVSSPDAATDPAGFAAALVEMSEVRLQTRAAMAVLHTANSLAQEMLSLPRR
ncbi:MAG: hypothetical protein Q8K78_14385 [Planctomycetaceae bacterium]|nr:hypothetical protein [Planctomycetaceae bacterium]